jgi:hypothetical protein
MGDTFCLDGAFQGGGNKILASQLVKGFWTPFGGGNFISHNLLYPEKRILKKPCGLNLPMGPLAWLPGMRRNELWGTGSYRASPGRSVTPRMV